MARAGVAWPGLVFRYLRDYSLELSELFHEFYSKDFSSFKLSFCLDRKEKSIGNNDQFFNSSISSTQVIKVITI